MILAVVGVVVVLVACSLDGHDRWQVVGLVAGILLIVLGAR